MSKPERKIVVALLESYYGYRSEYTWGIKVTDDDKIVMPTNATQQIKINSLVRLLHALPDEPAQDKNHNNTNESEQWLDFLTTVHEEELKQAEVSGRDYLAQTLRAIRAYLLQKMADNEIFKTRLMALELAAKNAETAEAKAAAQAKLNAFSDKTDHLTPYFLKNMVGSDKVTVALGEKDVQTFMTNAMDDAKRPAPHIARLLRTMPKTVVVAAVAVETANESETSASAGNHAANDNNAAEDHMAADHHIAAEDNQITNNDHEVDEDDEAKAEQQRAQDLEKAHHKLAKKLAIMKATRTGRPYASHARLHKSKAPAKQEVENTSRELRRLQGKP